MARNKGLPRLQVNKMDKYVVPRPVWGSVVPDDTEGGQEKDRDPADKPSLCVIMTAIQDLRGSLEPKLGWVTWMLIFSLQISRKSRGRSITQKQMLPGYSLHPKRLEDQVQLPTEEHKKIMECLEDQEGRARRNNIRVVVVPEGAEGPSVELLLGTLIVDSLCPKRLSKFFTVERAHRAPVPPRAQIFNFQDRDAILQATRSHGDLQYENTTARFFPHFTLRVPQRVVESKDGGLCESNVSIAESFAAHYEEVYTLVTRMTEEDCAYLLWDNPLSRLLVEERDKLDAELSEEKVTMALQGLQLGKAACPNGLPMELFKCLGNKIVRHMLAMFLEAREIDALEFEEARRGLTHD
ncbi:hypothetical protein NDU88_003400 [Pleurodeles waltl]|uniref:Uncharacterized protein n=1 Tax=Pleurodeles waltl TaxID=8319 RepID=A0AAV7LIH2_PLEWA|nr:hypothetical protein NDU88_003400 [Pleurodeles waltl]